jgi:hypothetical protein
MDPFGRPIVHTEGDEALSGDTAQAELARRGGGFSPAYGGRRYVGEKRRGGLLGSPVAIYGLPVRARACVCVEAREAAAARERACACVCVCVCVCVRSGGCAFRRGGSAAMRRARTRGVCAPAAGARARAIAQQRAPGAPRPPRRRC